MSSPVTAGAAAVSRCAPEAWARKALQAAPGNLEVLLSPGVSHTTELDQGHALTYLNRWLSHHPVHRAVLQGQPPDNADSSQRLQRGVRLFVCLGGGCVGGGRGGPDTG